MDIYMVGVYKGNNGDIKGFRMLSFDESNKQINDVEYAKVYEVLRSKSANIVNLKLEKGEIKGCNGKIDRYGIVGKTQSLVVLREVQDTKRNFLGYMCSDSLGNMRFLTEQQVIGFATSASIANGKVVTDNTGKSRVSAIEGTYSVYIKKDSYNNSSVNNSQSSNTSGLDAETVSLLTELKTYPEYNKSFAKKVEDTIRKTNKCTEKQKACLKKVLAELKNKNSNPTTNTQAPKQQSDEPVKSEPKQENKEVSQPKPVEKPTYVSDVFVYENMNGQIYIKGLKEDKKFSKIDILIPDTFEHDGKTLPVIGISSNAFNYSFIKSVVAGKNIRDIGQAAFMSCALLTNVDLSAAKHQHIAMNTFKDCKTLRAVNVGSYVQRIHESAFENCISLESIELPDTADTIARTAFQSCVSLKSVKSNVTTINDSAFRSCTKLREFDFSKVVNIGTQAFRYTAFENLVLPGNITNVGRKAFADCYELKDIKLEEGIEVLGEYCFAKPKKKDRPRDADNRNYNTISNILTCRSLKEIGADAFRNAELVQVYTGSVAESQCIGFGITHERLDGTTMDNSTRVRIKAEVIDSNPIDVLFASMRDNTEGASNPPMELKTTKLVDIPFNQTNFDFFKIPQTEIQVEPHVKFIGLVNYLQDVSDLYTLPLSNITLRLQQTYNVNSEVIYNDNCNRVYKVTYSLMDTLEEGGFIMVIMDNHLRFVAELKIATDINVNEYSATDENLPIKKFIHAGDKIGNTSTISGHNGLLIKEDGQVNVGKILFERLSNHAIEIIPQRKDSIWYIPAVGMALKLHDKREWEKDTYSKDGRKIARNSEDCLNVLQVMTYEELLEEISKFKKHSIDSNKFFKDLAAMSDSEVKNRIDFLARVEEEKEAQLFQVSKQFISKLQAAEKPLEQASPNDLTLKLFDELSTSYWMITKDEKWLSTTGTKSLNKTNEYSIDNCKLIEYKSNQVVKFSNPYMNGQKGAYVFTLMSGSRIKGVYASRHSMSHIVTKLVKLTQMKIGTVPIDLLSDAHKIDLCEHDLFYNFYDVLYSKDGWRFKDYCLGYNRVIYNLSADFHIAMYKPTGVFYLTMESFVASPDGERGRRTMPILPIGNMDRALMIATTTNSKNKDSKLLEELLVLSAAVIARANGVSIPTFKFKREIDIDAYFKARELVIAGVKDIKQYKQLVNDRVVYMLGTVHKGKLQREYEYSDSLDLNIDASDEDLYGNEEIDIYIPTSDGEGDYDDNYIDIEDDSYGEDEMIDIYGDEEESSIPTNMSDDDLIGIQQQLKAQGHELSLEQIRIMLMQQMK